MTGISQTLNAALFAANNVGWLAPTSVQPISAGLFDGSIANVVPGGPSLTYYGSIPAQTAAVPGQSLGYVTTNQGAGLDTAISTGQVVTFASIVRIKKPVDNTTKDGTSIFTSYADISCFFDLVARCNNNEADIQMWSANLSGNTFSETAVSEWGSWQILIYIGDVSGAQYFNRLLMPTQNIDNIVSTPGNTPGSNSGLTYLIGASRKAGTMYTASMDVAMFGVWDSRLSNDDLTALTNWMRRYAQSYGTTI
ncbi:hypothetical protein [Acetobacter persici]|uniref:hypothetical protein n=1 Tax=Acetobacter persici TaxID=1076596 RepID=UPI001BA8E28C|nr:hypothetical protein [Acetobacter persici]MBS1014503.1 hypothetical protein [Acetobacter persici]